MTEAKINYRNIVLSIPILAAGITLGISSAATHKQIIVIGFTIGTETIRAIAPHAAVMEAMPEMTYNVSMNTVSAMNVLSFVPLIIIAALTISILMGMFMVRGGMGG